MTSPKTLARITGVLYIVGSVGPVLAMGLRSVIVEFRDAAATADHIRASEPLLRVNIAVGLVSLAAWLFAVTALYRLLRHASQLAAGMMVIIDEVRQAFAELGVGLPGYDRSKNAAGRRSRQAPMSVSPGDIKRKVCLASSWGRPRLADRGSRVRACLRAEHELPAVPERQSELTTIEREARQVAEPDDVEIAHRARRAGGPRRRTGQDRDRPAARLKWTRGLIAAVHLVGPGDRVAVGLRGERPVRLELDRVRLLGGRHDALEGRDDLGDGRQLPDLADEVGGRAGARLGRRDGARLGARLGARRDDRAGRTSSPPRR